MSKTKAASVSTRKRSRSSERAPVSTYKPTEFDIGRAIFNKHFTFIRRLEAKRAEIEKEVADAYTEAKKEKVDGDMIKIALDAEESAKGTQKWRLKSSKIRLAYDYRGIPLSDSQLELFGARDSEWDQYYEAGKTAALSGEPRKPPPELGRHDASRWIDGHMDGTVVANHINSQGFKQLAVGDVVSAAVKELAAKAGISPDSLGASVLDDETEH